MKKTVGVLALQGAVNEHLSALNQLPNINGIAVKTTAEINQVDGLILPGGESTAIGKLMVSLGLREPLRKMARSGLPIWGTCAGMILLAKKLENDETTHLGCMDICVKRNAYGSQLNSFTTEAFICEVSPEKIPLVFIRAPYITTAALNVTPLYSLENKIVAARQANMLATSFHPELTNSLSFHHYFIKKFINQ